jgi:hypothetical protein
VNPAGGTGGVTVTPVINSSGPWFNEQAISLSNTGNLTALSITIVVQRTTGISHSGQYNTVGSQILQSNSSTTSTITYTFTLATGQTLGVGTNRMFAGCATYLWVMRANQRPSFPKTLPNDRLVERSGGR